MNTNTDVLIIGAGPTGLTMATLLASYNINFRIVDKSSSAAVESRAVGVQARTLELWHKLGLANGAIEDGMPLNDLYLLNKRTANKQGKPFLTLGRDGASMTPYPYLLIFEQYKTEQMLAQYLETISDTVSVERNISLVDFEPDGDGVTVTLEHADGTVETVRTRYLVGCDGANSLVRRNSGLGFEGDTYDQSLFVADVDLDWSLDNDKFYVETPRQGLLAFFPMRGHSYGDTHYRMLGRLPIGMKEQKELSQNDLQTILDDFSVIDARIKDTRWVSVYRIHSRMVESFQKGRLFVVGDAAHIHSPAGGQGMNTGIQDAWNLAWKLALVVRGDAKAELLESYSPERLPVARAVLNGSDRGFSFIATPNFWVHQIRQCVMPLISALASNRRIGSKIFKMVSQVWIGYRGSNAVAEATSAEITAGDRAPHAILNNGQNVLDLMTGVDHHLLIFTNDNTVPATGRKQLSGFEHLMRKHVITSEEHAVRNAYAVVAPTMMLVRPDGHIAWRGDLNDVDGLLAFFGRIYNPCVQAETAKVPT